MSKICSITKARPIKGSTIHRRGLAKKKGGIGQHVTKAVPRTFLPNLEKETALGNGTESLRHLAAHGARVKKR
jgi:large subunit ribosomal protein L28